MDSIVASNLVGHADDILVHGPPWRTSVFVFFTERAEHAHQVKVIDRPHQTQCDPSGRVPPVHSSTTLRKWHHLCQMAGSCHRP